MKENNPRHERIKKFLAVLTRRKIVVAGLIVILLFVLVALLAPVIAPYDPYEQDYYNMLSDPSAEHWLGTDSLGRDVLSRIIYGTRISLLVGITSILFAGSIGMVLGLITGYFGGWIDTIVMRIADAQMAIPPLVQALVIGAILGGGMKNLVISIAFSMIPTYIRLMRGQVMSVKTLEYVNVSISLGCKTPRLLFTHILPNCLSPLIVLVTQNLGSAILTEANLSFLGLGIAPPQASWGAMVSDGYTQLMNHPVLSIAPGLFVMIVVLAFNMVGDGVRDALDPRLRGTK